MIEDAKGDDFTANGFYKIIMDQETPISVSSFDQGDDFLCLLRNPDLGMIHKKKSRFLEAESSQ